MTKIETLRRPSTLEGPTTRDSKVGTKPFTERGVCVEDHRIGDIETKFVIDEVGS